MGLDLIIKSPVLVKHYGTGVFIRKNGRNIELKTKKEVKEYFSNFDTSHVIEQVYEDDKLISIHITHNLTEMASHVITKDNIDLYQLLWHPNENSFDFVNQDYILKIKECLDIIINNQIELEKYNPPNGYGNYYSLLNFVTELFNAISTIDTKLKYQIIASR